MKYKISEVFYSVQSEGYNTGMPAIFIRFFGCNLSCGFCDEIKKEWKEYEINDIIKVLEQWKCKNIILTGGEPTLQIDYDLLHELNKRKYKLYLETNGIESIPVNQSYFEWITISPKTDNLKQKVCDEIKIVYNGQTEEEIKQIIGLVCMQIHQYIYLQPESNKKEYIDKAIKLLEKNKNWRLSIQWHKLINIK